LSVGRLVEFKGFDVLIEACTKLDPDFTCEIIGEGELRDDLQTRINDRGLADRIHLSGERSQDYVLRAIADCDIFVLAAMVDSRGASDVFPTVIAEAMTSGKPVVSTTIAGIPELVAKDETGLLVPPRDPDALAAALSRLFRDEKLRAELGRAGRERIEEQFTIEKTIEPLLQRFLSGNKAASARA
jgi:glycosyltransferase involved in cell wall biosynthesis